MNRRHFLFGTALFTVGAAVSPLLTRLTSSDSSFQTSDTERALLGFYEPSSADLKQLFPQIRSYADALAQLQQKGMLIYGQLDLDQLAELAKTDPVMDYQGWQHLQSELLIYLAAYLLVTEALCQGDCSSRPQLQPKGGMVLAEGIDFYGKDIRAVKIEQPDDVSAAENCAVLCSQDAACEFFTLARNSHPQAVKQHACWLKGPGVIANKDPHYISGIKQQH